ncbi:hypothetical protein GCM10022199_19670 [Marihabitans asiaticum]
MRATGFFTDRLRVAAPPPFAVFFFVLVVELFAVKVPSLVVWRRAWRVPTSLDVGVGR